MSPLSLGSICSRCILHSIIHVCQYFMIKSYMYHVYIRQVQLESVDGAFRKEENEWLQQEAHKVRTESVSSLTKISDS